MRIQTLASVLVVSACALIAAHPSSAGPIVNPSFEHVGSWSIHDVAGWDATIGGFWGNGWGGSVTDGAKAPRFYLPTSGRVSAGDYSSLSQSVDLTFVDEISFDAILTCAPFGCGWHSFLEASFSIDGATAWIGNALGQHLNILIDTSAMAGVHTIEFSQSAVAGGSAGGFSSHFSFDNMRAAVVPEPGIALLLALGLAGAMTAAAATGKRLG